MKPEKPCVRCGAEYYLVHNLDYRGSSIKEFVVECSGCREAGVFSTHIWDYEDEIYTKASVVWKDINVIPKPPLKHRIIKWYKSFKIRGNNETI